MNRKNKILLAIGFFFSSAFFFFGYMLMRLRGILGSEEPGQFEFIFVMLVFLLLAVYLYYKVAVKPFKNNNK